MNQPSQYFPTCYVVLAKMCHQVKFWQFCAIRFKTSVYLYQSFVTFSIQSRFPSPLSMRFRLPKESSFTTTFRVIRFPSVSNLLYHKSPFWLFIHLCASNTSVNENSGREVPSLCFPLILPILPSRTSTCALWPVGAGVLCRLVNPFKVSSVYRLRSPRVGAATLADATLVYTLQNFYLFCYLRFTFSR